VDGNIGTLKQILGAVVLVGAQGDADADGGGELATFHGEGRCNRGLEALRHTEGIARVGDAFEENGEFVSAQTGEHSIVAGNLVSRTGHGIVVAQGRGQAAAQFHHHLISGNRSPGVVESLEIINVHQEQGVLVVGVSLGANERTLQAVQQQPAVRQSGEAVME
jgi:hypothetical protein